MVSTIERFYCIVYSPSIVNYMYMYNYFYIDVSSSTTGGSLPSIAITTLGRQKLQGNMRRRMDSQVTRRVHRNLPCAIRNLPCAIRNLPCAIRNLPVPLGTSPVPIGTSPVPLGTSPVSLGTLHPLYHYGLPLTLVKQEKETNGIIMYMYMYMCLSECLID